MDVVLLSPEDYFVLGEDQFGVPGLEAREVLGPFVRLQALGPLLMVHDSVWEPRHGIGHHPHRLLERLFYIMEGAVDHDDALNGITGHMGTGDLGRLTEGRRGMLHQEWNNTDGRARAFILVYEVDPVPGEASFEALRDADAPRYEEAPGVETKELVGSRSPLSIHGDIRLFADSDVAAGASLPFETRGGEGGLLFTVQGEVELSSEQLAVAVPAGHAVAFAPSADPREVRMRSPEGARVLRVVHGTGRGIVLD